MQLREFHPTVLAADSADIRAGTLTRLSSAFTRGAPAAAASGVLSIVNTGLDFVGADMIDTADQIERMFGQETRNYYEENQGAIDLVGFVAASFLPGSLGIKGLRALRAGSNLGSFGKYLGYAHSRKHAYLKEALTNLEDSGGVMRNFMASSARRKQALWEAVDWTQDTLAAELAVIVAMHNSPVFDDWTYSDFVWNTALGAGLGGVIGGTAGSLVTRGILRKAESVLAQDLRMVDTFFDPRKLGLDKGTEIAGFLHDIYRNTELDPKRVFAFNYSGEMLEHTFDVEKLATPIAKRAHKQALDEVPLKFNELAEGSAHIGQAYREFALREIHAQAISAGSMRGGLEAVQSKLQNISSVRPITFDDTVRLNERRFFSESVIDPGGKALLREEIGTVPVGSTYNVQFRLNPGFKDADVVVMQHDAALGPLTPKTFDLVKKKHDLDVDIITDAQGNTHQINPRSKRVTALSDNDHRIQMYIDLPTGTVDTDTVVTFADTLKNIEDVKFSANGLFKEGKFINIPATAQTKLTQTAYSASRRYAWAHKLSQADFMQVISGVGRSIDPHDIPMLMRLDELMQEAPEAVINRNIRIGNMPLEQVVMNQPLNRFINDKRMEIFEEGLRDIAANHATVPEQRILAANLGVDYEWVEDALVGAHRLDLRFRTADALVPKSVLATWDFNFAKTMDAGVLYQAQMGSGHLATAAISHQVRIQSARNMSKAASASAMGQYDDWVIDVEDFAKDKNRTVAQHATGAGAGSGMLSASDADYGAVAEIAAQEMGKRLSIGTLTMKDAIVQGQASLINAFRHSEAAGRELGALTSALRGNPNNFFFVPGSTTQIVAEPVLREIKKEAAAVAKMGGTLSSADVDRVIHKFQTALKPGEKPIAYTIRDAEASAFFHNAMKVNKDFLDRENILLNAVGIVRKAWDDLPAYAPPINTKKYPYYAFVKTKEQVGVPTDVGMIVARTDEELRTLARDLDADFDVFFAADTQRYFKAKNQYEYGLSMNENLVNSTLARRGKLHDYFVEVRADNVLADYLEWQGARVDKLFRTAAQVKNRQMFNELEFLSDQYRTVAHSRIKGVGEQLRAQVKDPYDEYIKLALNISKQQEFVLLSSLNEVIDKLGITIGSGITKAWFDAKNGNIPWEEANKVIDRYGLGRPYQNMEQFFVANKAYPTNVIRDLLQKGNLALATLMLRFDTANSIINTISTPIMMSTEYSSIVRRLKEGDESLGALLELTRIKIPGRPEGYIPSFTKLAFEAASEFNVPVVGRALTERFTRIGAIKTVFMEFHESMDMLSDMPKLLPSEATKKMNEVIEKVSTLTLNNPVEFYTRFCSANFMKKLSDPLVNAGKMSIREQDAFINTYVNRVQGNYTTSQRPILFQGTTGAAISLFQTYVFNVFRQLFRHAQAGDAKTLAVFAGMQTSVFGLNGLPMFEAINTHIIGNWMAGNPENRDAYTTLAGFNPELGNWLLYGTASAFPLLPPEHAPALFSRGDINPRHITIVPYWPTDIPVVSASLKLLDTIFETGRTIVQGGDVTDALLRGLQHNGWNRPLAGFAQILGGESVTNRGTLISAHNEMENVMWHAAIAERMVEYGGVSRLLGARPMNEALALDVYHRQKQYQALDRARITALGATVKTKLGNNEVPTEEELFGFMEQYAAFGGRIENFQRAMTRWSRDANVSMVNVLAQNMNSQYGRALQELMGGELLDDWRVPLE